MPKSFDTGGNGEGGNPARMPKSCFFDTDAEGATWGNLERMPKLSFCSTGGEAGPFGAADEAAGCNNPTNLRMPKS